MKIINLLKFILSLFKKQKPLEIVIVTEPEPVPITPPLREQFYNLAKSFVGVDISPLDVAPDNLACMEGVDNLYHHFCGTYINGTKTKVQVSTTVGNKIMAANPARFKPTLDLLPGNIIMSATGSSSLPNPPEAHGHVGVVGENGLIYSNNSRTGKWDTHLTIDDWVRIFRKESGYPIKLYEVI